MDGLAKSLLSLSAEEQWLIVESCPGEPQKVQLTWKASTFTPRVFEATGDVRFVSPGALP